MHRFASCAFALTLLASACGGKGDEADHGADADADTDADGDGDTDADADGDGDTDADSDTDSDVEIPEDAMEGEIILMDGGGEGEVLAARAFSYSDGKATLIYVSANTAATCTLAADYLGAEEEDPVDPTDLFEPGMCNLVFSLIGGAPMDVDLESSVGVLVHTDCALGDGKWEYKSVGSQTGYFWSGTWYIADAYQGEFTVSDGKEGVDVDGDLDSFDGQYPFSGGTTKARATVAGHVYGETCSALSETSYF